MPQENASYTGYREVWRIQIAYIYIYFLKTLIISHTHIRNAVDQAFQTNDLSTRHWCNRPACCFFLRLTAAPITSRSSSWGIPLRRASRRDTSALPWRHTWHMQLATLWQQTIRWKFWQSPTYQRNEQSRHVQSSTKQWHGAATMLDNFQTSVMTLRKWFMETSQTITLTIQRHSHLNYYWNSACEHLSPFLI